MKKYLFPAALATTLLATSCSDNDMAEPITPDGQKELISLTLGLGDDTPAMAKRAGRASYGFTDDTRIIMRIQSDDNEAATGNHRYTKTLATAGVRGANPSTGADQQFSSLSPVGAAYRRYWDDAFGRNAYLSVFAVAIPNKNDEDLLPEDKLEGSNTKWETTTENAKAADNTINWTVASTQTTTTLDNEDLIYSRNIRKGASDAEAGRYVWSFTNTPQGYVPNIKQALTGTNVFTKDRMRFTLSKSSDNTSPGKFDKGHLIFNHALSRLTITIKSGEGFDANTKFVLSNAGVQALGMKISGTLDVSTGLWADGATTGTISTKPSVVGPDATTTYASYKTSMQMLPGYAFKNGSTTNVLKFTIDDNEYYITQDLIFDALKDNAANNGLSTSEDSQYTMEQGKNYVLTITVNKTQIANITATLAEWEDVEAAEKPLYNSYVTLSLNNTEGTACEDFDLYRLPKDAGGIHTSQTRPSANDYENYEWGGNYTDYLTTEASASEDKKLIKYTDAADRKEKWKTPWFFEDNRTFYHFRTVKAGTTIYGTTDNTDDYFAINDGPISGANEVDPHWGAPLKSGITEPAKQYNTTANTPAGAHEGYTDIIYKAIGSTTGAIAIQEFHMLSEIKVIVKTKTEAEGGVKLFDDKGTAVTTDDVYTTVTLYQFAQNGQVKMGNGFVTALAPYTHSQALTQPATFFKTDPTETNAFTWRVVPQSLNRDAAKTDKVAIKIQTPDNNLYYCIEDLSTIKPQGSSSPITDWLPNHRYIYTFIISKKGIDQITCTVADWIDVKAADKDITLED